MIREHCVSNLVTCSSYVSNSQKLVEGELWAEVTSVTIWVILRFYLVCAKSYETIFVWCHISFCWFFALKVMRGHDFWTHLKMCVIIFDLLPTVLESGTVSGEIGS